MAKYFYLKVSDEFLSHDSIKLLKAEPEGHRLAWTYLCLILKAVKEPEQKLPVPLIEADWDAAVKTLAVITDETPSIMSATLKACAKLGLIDVEMLITEQKLHMPFVNELSEPMVGSKTDAAIRMKKMRERKKVEAEKIAAQQPTLIPEHRDVTEKSDDKRDGMYEKQTENDQNSVTMLHRGQRSESKVKSKEEEEEKTASTSIFDLFSEELKKFSPGLVIPPNYREPVETFAAEYGQDTLQAVVKKYVRAKDASQIKRFFTTDFPEYINDAKGNAARAELEGEEKPRHYWKAEEHGGDPFAEREPREPPKCKRCGAEYSVFLINVEPNMRSDQLDRELCTACNIIFIGEEKAAGRITST